MDDQLNVIDLYQRANSKRINAFERKIISVMVVDLHYDKLGANFLLLVCVHKSRKK